jgi:hypothetical protein
MLIASKPQILRCFELVVATFAGPGVTDVAFAHVFRRVWCNQTVIAQDILTLNDYCRAT